MKRKFLIFSLLIVILLVLFNGFSTSGTMNIFYGVSGPSEIHKGIQHGLWIYLVPLFVIWSLYLGLRSAKFQKNRAIKNASVKAGLTEPVSLHPVINPNRCKGCGSCVNSCPEQDSHAVLGIIDGKCNLISPGNCIGHGVCAEVCPQEAITLVFGTATRGVDIPPVDSNLETNIPGIFIAGELGGKGLIRNAIIQGCQAVESVCGLDGIGQDSILDMVIVGAGPAGFSASLAAMQKNLRFVTLEQEKLGGTVAHYPRGKIVMTAPVNLPMVGEVNFKETTKEYLLEFWQDVEQRTNLKINYSERVTAITKTDQGFQVSTDKDNYRTKAVLLAIGRRGTPRKLNVAGEDLSKVVYRLNSPDQYRGKNVLVVGGGDSALEAAVSIAEEKAASVWLSYRGSTFSRAKEQNRQKIKSAETEGYLQIIMESQVQEIQESHVQIECGCKLVEIENDAVIVCAGGVLPTPFLKNIGINVETKYGTP